MDRTEAVRWVAENVMGYERKPCEGDIKWHTAGTFKDGYVCEGGFYCRWCGKQRADGWSEPCPEYPFPAFDLVQLMRRLGEQRVRAKLIVNTGEAVKRFTLVDGNEVIHYTDDPFGDLCKWLVEKYNG